MGCRDQPSQRDQPDSVQLIIRGDVVLRLQGSDHVDQKPNYVYQVSTKSGLSISTERSGPTSSSHAPYSTDPPPPGATWRRRPPLGSMAAATPHQLDDVMARSCHHDLGAAASTASNEQWHRQWPRVRCLVVAFISDMIYFF